MNVTRKLDILRYSEGELRPVSDTVVAEYSLRLLVNGALLDELFCTPQDLRELVLGRLYAGGLIAAADDVSALEIDEDTGIASVEIAEPAAHTRLSVADISACYHAEALLKTLTQFYAEAHVFRATGGAHAAALCDASGILLYAIDIGRHNAVDKVLGYALERSLSLANVYLITSGRVPGDVARKVVCAGVPVLVSRAAPTDAAVEFARNAGLTLLGFAKEDRFNIYSGPQRVEFSRQ